MKTISNYSKFGWYAYFISIINSIFIGFSSKSLDNPSIFVRFYDLEFRYLALTNVSKDLSNFEISNFNWFDQVPKYFLHLLGGVYNPESIITSIIITFYNIFQDFNFKIVLISSLLIVTGYKTIVVILLLRNLKIVNKHVILLSIIIFNCSIGPLNQIAFPLSFAYLNVMIIATLYIRMLMHKMVEIETIFIIGILVISNYIFSPLFGVGYLYLGFNVLTISFLILFSINYKSFGFTTKFFSRNSILFLSMLSLPLIIITTLNLREYVNYYIPKNVTRLDTAFNLKSYYDMKIYYAEYTKFFVDIINFNNAAWGSSWPYLGPVVIFFVLYSFFFINSLCVKYAQIVLFFFIAMNMPRNIEQISSFFHLLNFFTNPFSFLNRSFHMVGALMLFIPISILFILGINSFITAVPNFFHERRRIFLFAIICIIYLTYISQLVEKFYFIVIIFLCLFSIQFIRYSNNGFSNLRFRRLVVILIMVIFTTETFLNLTQDSSYQDSARSFVSKVNNVNSMNDLREVNFFIDPPPLNVYGLKNDFKEDQDNFDLWGQSFNRGQLLNCILISKYFEDWDQYRPRARSYLPINSKNLNNPIYKSESIVQIFNPNIYEFVQPIKLPKKLLFDADDLVYIDTNLYSLPFSIQSVASQSLPCGNPNSIKLKVNDRDFEQTFGWPSNEEFEFNTLVKNQLTLNSNSKINRVELVADLLQKDGVTNVNYINSNTLKIELHSTSIGNIAVILIPYSENFKIEVNNVEVNKKEFNNFIGVPISSGNSTVTIQYDPNFAIKLITPLLYVYSLIFFLFIVSQLRKKD
jgi:hypothetical protein